MARNLLISFQRRTYQVTGHGKGYRLRGASVTVCKGFDGSVTVLRDGCELPESEKRAYGGHLQCLRLVVVDGD